MRRTKTHRRAAAVTAVVALVAAVGAGSAHAAKTVLTRGGDEFAPNEFVRSSLRFAPGTITVRPGERVTWVDGDQSRDPHTVTVVNARNVPDTIEEVFECQVCGLAGAHLEDPNDPSSGIATFRLNAGPPGFNTEGDSILFMDGQRISARINTTAGRTLRYICAIHPWMQGAIRVTRAGTQAPTGPALTGRHH